MPVSSYAPEFLELFKTAAREECIIPLGNRKRAMRLRFRLNMLRKNMRKEGHSLTTIANSVEFTITHEGDLKCTPADDTFLPSLRKAGIAIEAPPTASTSPPQPFHKTERTEAEEVIRKFLGTPAPNEDKE